ncbi:CDGSH iron-sulfur domain-containing protein [Nocardioides kribbensis]|uniref:CDGSH iron-sulfur domain-containing protein n=1 Tax=Nocardioides kribbensis TaxID=305517 RepID=A0ABV1NTB1_9ACTN
MSTPQADTPADPEPAPVVLKVVDSGPLQIKGPIRLLDHDGTPYDVPARRAVFLCRCGQSRTKPFCDGSHRRTGFSATERADGAKPDASPDASTSGS